MIKMEPTIFEAVLALVGGTLEMKGDSFDSINYLSKQTAPLKAEAETKLAELISAWDAQEYARNRASAYDSVGDQLDMLMKDMKNNTTTHQESCEAVKAKYPKPE
jgi:hypothetical protein